MLPAGGGTTDLEGREGEGWRRRGEMWAGKQQAHELPGTTLTPLSQ